MSTVQIRRRGWNLLIIGLGFLLGAVMLALVVPLIPAPPHRVEFYEDRAVTAGAQP